MPGLLDGISSSELLSSVVSGTESQFSTGSFANARVGTNFTAAGSLSDGLGRVRPLGAGSPTVYGKYLQTGSMTASDVSVSVVFGTAFAAIPRVVVSSTQSGTLSDGAWVGSTITTGFNFWGQSGLAYNYIAVGA